MRVAVVAVSVIVLLGCTGPGTPEQRATDLPAGFPADFPLHPQFHPAPMSRKLDWDKGDHFLVKFVTELQLHQIHQFFLKQLAQRAYTRVSDIALPGGAGKLLQFRKGTRSVEISIGTEKGKSTFLLRLKEKRK